MTKQEAMAKWLKALRSGEYEQITGALFDGRGYCCLGVCVAAALPYEFKGNEYDWGYSDEYWTAGLAPEERAFLELDEIVTEDEYHIIAGKFGIYPPRAGNRQHFMWYLNDSHKMSFPEIADVMEYMGWDK